MTKRSVYGLRRLALLDSARYASAVIPLDDSVGLVAANNHGKTGLINALQFLFIPSKSRQNFVKYTRERSQEFYFPNPTSYVLLELLTSDGAIVVGCVGRGALQAYDYSYFSYRGELDLKDYRDEAGKYVRGTELQAHMEQLGRQVFFYTRDEYRDQLFARGREPSPGEPDFGIFKLAPRIKPDLFQMIFGRVLRLDELNAASVKTNLIALYGDGQPQGMNFKQAWEASRQGVTAKRLMVNAAVANGPKITRLAELRDRRIALRSEAVHFMPIIDTALEGWEKESIRKRAESEGKVAHHRQEREALVIANQERSERLGGVAVQIRRVEAEAKTHEELSQEFSLSGLTATEEGLRDEITRLNDSNYELQQRIKAARDHGASALADELDSIVRSIAAVVGQMQDESLKGALHEHLPAQAADALSRALSPEVLALGPVSYTLGDTCALRSVDPSAVVLAGLTVDVSGITPRPHETKDELEGRLGLLRQKEAEARERLAAAKDLEARQEALARGREDEIQARQRLERFRKWRDLEDSAGARTSSLASLREQSAAINAEIHVARERTRELDGVIEEAKSELNRLEGDVEAVKRLMGTRPERSAALIGMERLEISRFHTSGWPKSIPNDHLRKVMEEQERRCNALIRLEGESSKLLSDLSRAGLSSLAEEGGPEEEIKALIEYWENIDQERSLLDREEEQAAALMKSELDQLLKGLDVFKARVKDFNSRIRRQPISDLEVFQITVVPDPDLVGALETLINSGTLFAAENAADLQAALGVLGRQPTLSFESLFSLQFEVKKRGLPIKRHSSLEAAGSDGTTAMAKLVIGLAMLSMLRDRRRGSELRAACYLDEAARLDQANQAALIEMASDMGFTLVMAAPSQLMTPRWCVPVRSEEADSLTGEKLSFILESEWIDMEESELEPALGAAEAELA